MARHLIKYALTPEAQAIAARAGEPAQRAQEVALPPEFVGRALDLGAEVEADGSVVLDYAPGYGGVGRLPRRPRDAGEALDLIEANRTAREEEEAARAAKVEEESAKRRAESVARAREVLEAFLAGTDSRLVIYEIQLAEAAWPELYARAREVEVERRKAEAEAEAEATQARADAQAQAHRARLARLAELVREVSTDPLVLERVGAGRGPLGLLPEEEALELVLDAKLPVVEGVVDYSERKLTPSDARAECEEAGDDDYEESRCAVSYESTLPEALTPDEWREVRAIRAALKAAGLPEGQVRLHTGTCACQSAAKDAARRIGVVVSLDLGGVSVRREYAASLPVRA